MSVFQRLFYFFYSASPAPTTNHGTGTVSFAAINSAGLGVVVNPVAPVTYGLPFGILAPLGEKWIPTFRWFIPTGKIRDRFGRGKASQPALTSTGRGYCIPPVTVDIRTPRVAPVPGPRPVRRGRATVSMSALNSSGFGGQDLTFLEDEEWLALID